jgi:hypothetical protein
VSESCELFRMGAEPTWQTVQLSSPGAPVCPMGGVIEP